MGERRTRGQGGRGQRLTILAGPRITYTVLICKDALETWVPGLLQELRVRLVVVPSCNPGVSTYRNFAEGLALRGWCTVVLANIPPDDHSPREYGLLLRPASLGQKGVPTRPSEYVARGPHKNRISFSIRESI